MSDTITIKNRYTKLVIRTAARDDGVLDLTGADLCGADLSGADLSGADLFRANLRDANLRDADLSHANLPDADLSRANLPDANLRDATLTGADLSGANLPAANLYCANLSHANLSGANLRDADISRAKLYGVMGSNEWFRSVLFGPYDVVYTSEVLTVGCQTHTIDGWKAFTRDDIMTLMGPAAARHWDKYSGWLFQTIELFPAEPTTKEADK